MTVWTSFLWNINIQLVEKRPEMVIKLVIVIVIRFYSDYSCQLKKNSVSIFFFRTFTVPVISIFLLQIWGFCSYHHTVVLLLKISAYSMQFTSCNFQRICPSSEHSAICTVEDYWQKNCHNGGSVALIREMGWLYIIDTIQDFLCKWGTKPCMQLLYGLY